MEDLEHQILAAVGRKNYKPLKPKALARKLGVPQRQYPVFRQALRELLRQGRLEAGKDHTVRAVPPHGTVTGTFRKTASGTGYVRPRAPDGTPAGPDILI